MTTNAHLQAATDLDPLSYELIEVHDEPLSTPERMGWFAWLLILAAVAAGAFALVGGVAYLMSLN